MPEFCLRVIDLETVGFLHEQPPEVQADPCKGVVELGWTDVLVNVGDDGVIAGVEVDFKYGALLYKPPGGIPPEASAVHHLTDADVAHCLPCGPSIGKLLTESPTRAGAPFALVAHNKDFEAEWLGKYLPAETRWICTLKVAAQLHPEWPSHSNQACRYRLGLTLDEDLCMPPHRAGPDSYVTAHLLAAFLQQASARQMVAWTQMPKLMLTCPLGEHRGKPWDQVPADYLRWYVTKAERTDPDTLYWARQSLERRAEMARDPDLAAGEY